MDERIIPLLQQAEALKTELDNLRPLDKEREAIVLQKLRLDWNFHSNHLEGNSLTFGETKALLFFERTANGKSLKDHNEIWGHDKAIKWVESAINKRELLTEHFIRELHTLLLKEPYEVAAITTDGKPTKTIIKVGEYKSTPNHVETKTGEPLRFATPEETPAKMFDLLEWYREKEADKETNPILFAADFHYKFIRIHPFDDGNGRMARLLMNFILMQYGYPPVIIKTGEKAQYIAALEQADAGIFEPFFELVITNETRSLELMLKGARGENIEEPDDLDKELALLEQKFQNHSPKLKKVSSINFHENNVRPFVESLISNCYKFNRFFSSIEVSVTFIISKLNDREDEQLDYKFRFDYLSSVDVEAILRKIHMDILNVKFAKSLSNISITASLKDFLFQTEKKIEHKVEWSFVLNTLLFKFYFRNVLLFTERPKNIALSKKEIEENMKAFTLEVKELIEESIPK